MGREGEMVEFVLRPRTEVLTPREFLLDIVPAISQAGVRVRMFVSPSGALARMVKNRFQGTEVYCPSQGLNHAKLLLVDNESALFGSHNYDAILVALGTEELSLLTARKHIVLPLINFFEKTINEGKLIKP